MFMSLLRAACFIVLLSVPVLSQTTPDRWIDYVAGDYDIFPNITYAKANNIELKLDLYLPKNRTNPTPTLILFHGGGWVDGQKERNVLFRTWRWDGRLSTSSIEPVTSRRRPRQLKTLAARCAGSIITRASIHSTLPGLF
jgi:hypothetical protein